MAHPTNTHIIRSHSKQEFFIPNRGFKHRNTGDIDRCYFCKFNQFKKRKKETKKNPTAAEAQSTLDTTQILRCCLRTVWTPTFTSTGPICLRRVSHPVWMRPNHHSGQCSTGIAIGLPPLPENRKANLQVARRNPSSQVPCCWGRGCSIQGNYWLPLLIPKIKQPQSGALHWKGSSVKAHRCKSVRCKYPPLYSKK